MKEEIPTSPISPISLSFILIYFNPHEPFLLNNKFSVSPFNLQLFKINFSKQLFFSITVPNLKHDFWEISLLPKLQYFTKLLSVIYFDIISISSSFKQHELKLIEVQLGKEINVNDKHKFEI